LSTHKASFDGVEVTVGVGPEEVAVGVVLTPAVGVTATLGVGVGATEGVGVRVGTIILIWLLFPEPQPAATIIELKITVARPRQPVLEFLPPLTTRHLPAISYPPAVFV